MASDPNQQRIDIFKLMEDRRVEQVEQGDACGGGLPHPVHLRLPFVRANVVRVERVGREPGLDLRLDLGEAAHAVVAAGVGLRCGDAGLEPAARGLQPLRRAVLPARRARG